jgi:hypothetical protein
VDTNTEARGGQGHVKTRDEVGNCISAISNPIRIRQNFEDLVLLTYVTPDWNISNVITPKEYIDAIHTIHDEKP